MTYTVYKFSFASVPTFFIRVLSRKFITFVMPTASEAIVRLNHLEKSVGVAPPCLPQSDQIIKQEEQLR